MKTMLLFALAILAGFGADANVLSKPHQDNWEKLGMRVVNMTADHDEILVTVTEGFFTRVKLAIMKAPIHLLNINIIFANGENKNVVLNQFYGAGSETTVIDLPGNKRVIKKVNLNYKSAPTQKGRAVVALWGKH